LALTGPMVYLGNILRAQQKVKFVYGYSLAYYLFLFAAYLSLIKYGLVGIVIARTIMYLVSAVIYVSGFLYYLKRSTV